jgi:hypothetical protein
MYVFLHSVKVPCALGKPLQRLKRACGQSVARFHNRRVPVWAATQVYSRDGVKLIGSFSFPSVRRMRLYILICLEGEFFLKLFVKKSFNDVCGRFAIRFLVFRNWQFLFCMKAYLQSECKDLQKNSHNQGQLPGLHYCLNSAVTTDQRKKLIRGPKFAVTNLVWAYFQPYCL